MDEAERRFGVVAKQLGYVNEAMHAVDSNPDRAWAAVRAATEDIRNVIQSSGIGGRLWRGEIGRLIGRMTRVKVALQGVAHHELLSDGTRENRDQFRGLVTDARDLLPHAAHHLERLKALRDLLRDIERDWPALVKAHERLPILAGFRPALRDVHRLMLAPGQDELVSSDHDKPFRLQGSSGSGKTAILIHRALRLADEAAANGGLVRIFTINRALADLIDTTVKAHNGGTLPPNLTVHAFYDFLMECRRATGTAGKERLFDERSGERIPQAWEDFYGKKEGDPRDNPFLRTTVLDLMASLKKQELGAFERMIYLRDEVDYVRSVCTPRDRNEYLTLRRDGRAIRFSRKQREAILEIVSGWETWLKDGHLNDPVGVASSAAEEWLKPDDRIPTVDWVRRRMPTRHVLVDESQDFSTIELSLLGRLIESRDAPNAMYFAGDENQRVLVRHTHWGAAGFDFRGNARVLSSNHRNTREILEACLPLVEAFPPPRSEGIEVRRPEFSSHRGARPAAFHIPSSQHVRWLLDSVKVVIGRGDARVAVLTESLDLIERLCREATKLNLLPLRLRDNTELDLWEGIDPDSRAFAVGRMDAAKGYEFDTVFAAYVDAGFIPRPRLPQDEMWRDATVLYVAGTRARQQLVFTFEDEPSPFLTEQMLPFIDLHRSGELEILMDQLRAG